jgi:hypothetical protein
MCRMRYLVFTVVVGCGAWQSSLVSAQQVQLTTPYHQLHDSFYENFGLGWGINRMGPKGGFFFNTGPVNSAPPPFGGYDPASDARFGAGIVGKGFNLGFSLGAGTGSTRSNVMESPTIVIPNGGSGSLFSGSQRPFVTSVVPVVGEGGVFSGDTPGVMPANQSSASPIRERLARLQQGEVPPQRHQAGSHDPDPPAAAGGQTGSARAVASSSADSTANHGDLSVTEIRRQQSAEEATRQAELLERLEKARSYEDAGKLSIAKVYYQQAAARATGEQKQHLLKKVQSLSPPASR